MCRCRKCFTTHKFGKKNEEAFEKACLGKHKPKTVAPVPPRTHMPTLGPQVQAKAAAGGRARGGAGLRLMHNTS